MSGKRQATSDLNHDNWDREEEPEERGTFKTASEKELKNRVIKKARRSIATGAADDADGAGAGASKSIFSGFSGFGKPTTSSAAASSAFSFLAKLPASTGPLTSVSSVVSSSTGANSSSFSFGLGAATPSAAISSDSTKKSTTFAASVDFASEASSAKPAGSFSFGATTSSAATKADSPTSASKRSDQYYENLKELNQAVSRWIKTHVDEDPLCFLTPIFKDYEKYLKALEEQKSKSETTQTLAENVNNPTTSSAATAGFKFLEADKSSTSTTATSSNSAAKTNGFSFGLMKPDEAAKPAASASTSPSSGFTFGLKTSAPVTSTPAAAGLSFDKRKHEAFSFTPGATPFTFANIKPPEAPSTSSSAAAANDDEDEEPPKNDFKQVVENDAVYSKKCKVFVKKQGNFVDKGVGTLYLKPVEANNKTQLLVRADTNLGNILVNIILSSGIPAQRMGKNNVMMVCLPTPDVEKPTSMLLRVKTGAEADELLQNIEKYKK